MDNELRNRVNYDTWKSVASDIEDDRDAFAFVASASRLVSRSQLGATTFAERLLSLLQDRQTQIGDYARWHENIEAPSELRLEAISRLDELALIVNCVQSILKEGIK